VGCRVRVAEDDDRRGGSSDVFLIVRDLAQRGLILLLVQHEELPRLEVVPRRRHPGVVDDVANCLPL